MQLTEQQQQMGWRIVKFGDVAKSVSKRVDPADTDLEVYVGLEHLDPGNLRITRRGVPSDVKGQKLLVKPEQIIFGKRRAYQRKVAVADFEGICSAHAMVLEAIPEAVMPEYLPFFMQSDMFMERAVAISEGSLSPTIKWKTLANQEFPLPPRPRQEEMLEIFEKIEDNLLLNNQALEKINTIVRSITLATILGSEDKVKLSDIAEIIMGQSPKGKNVIKENFSQSLPLLNGPSEFTDEFPIPVQYTTELTRISEKDDVLLCVRGSTTGRINVADQKYCIGRGLAAIRSKKNKSNTRYIMHALFGIQQSIYDRAKGAGSTFPNITRDELEKWSVSDVELDLQVKIANSMDLLLRAKKEILEKTKKLDNLKKCYFVELVNKEAVCADLTKPIPSKKLSATALPQSPAITGHSSTEPICRVSRKMC